MHSGRRSRSINLASGERFFQAPGCRGIIMKSFLPYVVLLLLVSPLGAEDVTQFRGAGGLGVSKETNLPTRWSATDGLRWKADLPGKGLSNPVIAGGRVYVTA